SSSQEENSVKVGHDNLHDVNVGEAPSNFTADLKKGTPDKSSYDNVTGSPSRSKVNFHTLFIPVGNEIDVVVLVESIKAISVNLLKEDVRNVPVWVRLHGVPVTAFSKDGLSVTSTKIDNIVVVMPKINGEGYYTCNIRVDTTLIIEKIDKIEKLIIDGKVTLVDDEGKPLENVEYSEDYDSEDEVSLVDNEMASFLARKDVYGNNSLLA
nr:hypothetical protein [Tanacetum cinerariifolium]